MKWFRHDTDARQDYKIKRLTSKYGVEGYGVYWSIVELLAFETKDNLDVCLSLDKFPVEDIAYDLKVDVKRLKEMLDFMAQIFLIDPECYSSNVLCCKALAKRADDYAQRQGRSMKRVRTESEQGQDQVLLKDSKGQERKEQERTVEEVWNSTRLPRILSWSASRSEHLKVRMRDPNFLSKYKEAIKKLAESDFANGKGPPSKDGQKPWQVGIDWFLENDNNYLKVLEGKYDNAVFDKYTRRV